jgi:hypothetical protein
MVFTGIIHYGFTYADDWTPPTATPPRNNVDVPINTGTSSQVKDVSLSVDTLLSTGEIVSTHKGTSGQLRMVSGDYGAFFRNDGFNTFFLLTNPSDQYGTWNDLRPLQINNSTGLVRVGNGLNVAASDLNVNNGVLSINGGDQTGGISALRMNPIVGATMQLDVHDGSFYFYGDRNRDGVLEWPVDAPVAETVHLGITPYGDYIGTEGSVRASRYCNKDGLNCFVPSDVANQQNFGGFWCGSATQGSAIRDSFVAPCQGHNPKVDCPAGFTSTITGEADHVYYYSCLKNDTITPKTYSWVSYSTGCSASVWGCGWTYGNTSTTYSCHEDFTNNLVADSYCPAPKPTEIINASCSRYNWSGSCR